MNTYTTYQTTKRANVTDLYASFRHDKRANGKTNDKQDQQLINQSPFSEPSFGCKQRDKEKVKQCHMYILPSARTDRQHKQTGKREKKSTHSSPSLGYAETDRQNERKSNNVTGLCKSLRHGQQDRLEKHQQSP